MGRLIFMTFWGENRADAEVQAHIHESPPIMTVPLVLLAIPRPSSACWWACPPEGGWIHSFLEPVFFDAEHEAFTLAGEGGLLMLASLRQRDSPASSSPGGSTCARRSVPGRIAERVPWAYRRASNKFYMDEFYAVVPVRATLGFASWLWTFVDAKVIDGAVNGIAWLWGWVGDTLRPLQTGRAQNYAMYVFGGMVVLVVVLAWVWGS